MLTLYVSNVYLYIACGWLDLDRSIHMNYVSIWIQKRKILWIQIQKYVSYALSFSAFDLAFPSNLFPFLVLQQWIKFTLDVRCIAHFIHSCIVTTILVNILLKIPHKCTHTYLNRYTFANIYFSYSFKKRFRMFYIQVMNFICTAWIFIHHCFCCFRSMDEWIEGLWETNVDCNLTYARYAQMNLCEYVNEWNEVHAMQCESCAQRWNRSILFIIQWIKLYPCLKCMYYRMHFAEWVHVHI